MLRPGIASHVDVAPRLQTARENLASDAGAEQLKLRG